MRGRAAEKLQIIEYLPLEAGAKSRVETMRLPSSGGLSPATFSPREKGACAVEDV
jgi:hypothetical protein